MLSIITLKRNAIHMLVLPHMQANTLLQVGFGQNALDIFRKEYVGYSAQAICLAVAAVVVVVVIPQILGLVQV